MEMIKRNQQYVINCTGFHVILKPESYEVWMKNEKHFDLSVRSGLSTDQLEDVDEELLAFEVKETQGVITASWLTRSNIWEHKAYILECRESSFLYYIKVKGKGKLTKLDFFAGGNAKKIKGSQYEAARYLLPVALGGGNENRYFTAAQSATIDLGYLVPPMFCYPFNMEDIEEWFGLGLVAKEGQYNFDGFSYHFISPDPGVSRFYLSTDLRGHTVVDGEWETPGILGVPGLDEFDVLKNYSKWHYESGDCKPPQGKVSDWWYGPLFCGWGEQCSIDLKNPFIHANETQYNKMSDRLEELGLKPTAIIIDDKWQTTFGEALPDPEKWPDFRSFVDRQHMKGRKVVLWFKAWNSEGLEADECVTLWSQPLGADPTSPKYKERMRRTIRKLLSSEEDCYNCDGFKIDFANCMPLGKGIQAYERGVYGVELLKRFFTLMYEYSKAVKEDALINCSCCHPYFAEVTDQARLHDYFGGMRGSKAAMTFRHKLFKAAMPEVLIDTDGASFCNYRDTMAYVRFAPQLGVPDLYSLSSSPEAVLTDKDWKEIKQIWEACTERIHNKK